MHGILSLTFRIGTFRRRGDLGSRSGTKKLGTTRIFATAFHEVIMSLGTILIIILVLALLGVIPNWGYSSNWGYGPSGIVGTILIIVLILLLLGRI